MSEANALPLPRPRRLRFDWILPALFRPRPTFAQIVTEARATWLTPLLLLTLAALLAVGVAGPIKIAAAQSGEIKYPPDFQYWPQEQQAQYIESQRLTSGPVFVYVFPALVAVLRVWFGWLVAGGLLHLVLTLAGGRGSTDTSLNVAAWASLPFAVRDLVRVGFMLSQHSLIASSGLAGFAPAGAGLGHLLAVQALSRIDIYGLWYWVLLYVGVRAAGGLPRGRALAAVIVTAVLVLALAVVPTALIQQFGGGLSGLNTFRPFF